MNGAKVLRADLVADNGVIHIIDTFLHTGANEQTALSYIENNGAFDDYDVRFE